MRPSRNRVDREEQRSAVSWRSFSVLVASPLFWSFSGVLFSLTLYVSSTHNYALARASLMGELAALESRKEQLLTTKDELEQRILSQQDPAWIEQLLREHLGLVSKGQTKVVFQHVEAETKLP